MMSEESKLLEEAFDENMRKLVTKMMESSV